MPRCWGSRDLAAAIRVRGADVVLSQCRPAAPVPALARSKPCGRAIRIAGEPAVAGTCRACGTGGRRPAAANPVRRRRSPQPGRTGGRLRQELRAHRRVVLSRLRLLDGRLDHARAPCRQSVPAAGSLSADPVACRRHGRAEPGPRLLCRAPQPPSRAQGAGLCQYRRVFRGDDRGEPASRSSRMSMRSRSA